MPQFIQLTKEDCSYLLDLIQSMDEGIEFTARQRAYTIPKLQRIMVDARSARLAYQDTEYLLELIEDDSLEECEQQREMTRQNLEAIKGFQSASFARLQDIEMQRESRRVKRNPGSALQEHFEQTRVG